MQYTYLFRTFIIFCLLLVLSVNDIQAQNAADPDTIIGLRTFNNTIRDTKIQTNGKILVAGDFNYYKETAINRLARLNADGTLDNTFNIGTGANESVYSIAITE